MKDQLNSHMSDEAQMNNLPLPLLLPEIERVIADWGAYYGMSRSVEMMPDEDYIDPFKGCSNPNCTRQLVCDFCAEYWHDYYFIGPIEPSFYDLNGE